MALDAFRAASTLWLGGMERDRSFRVIFAVLVAAMQLWSPSGMHLQFLVCHCELQEFVCLSFSNPETGQSADTSRRHAVMTAQSPSSMSAASNYIQ